MVEPKPGEPALKFKRGALVHFAVDQDGVDYASELDGDDTRFLSFNNGHDGGAGNLPREDSHPTAYRRCMWQSEMKLQYVYSLWLLFSDRNSGTREREL